MPLPVFDVPVFTVKLPSSGESVKLRPFLVKEQKQLLMAVANDIEEQLSAMENIIEACSFNKIRARQIPAFDAEYLFLQIRAKSIGENVEMQLTCGCGEKTNTKLDISTIDVHRDADHQTSFDLGSSIIVQMRYPRMPELEQFNERPNADQVIGLIASCIQSIWQGDEMFAAEDYSQQELVDFVEQLSPANLDKIQKFFSTMPVLRQELSWKCQACEKDNTVVLEGLQNFFD